VWEGLVLVGERPSGHGAGSVPFSGRPGGPTGVGTRLARFARSAHVPALLLRDYVIEQVLQHLRTAPKVHEVLDLHLLIVLPLEPLVRSFANVDQVACAERSEAHF